ncbi:hypothetical protein [Stenotrophomonas sp. RG-453]|uniref:hypothetical protein n=1 Tax=Stenotrophomonas sp. RG-453 TaxID=2957502 RepID=UPI0029C9F1B9|nr:hypothetical protein [Stenotrophomonas sp. RG-453]MDX5515082.1 hypothetical protein [Stenotrophomonas sp. RG-453]
MKELIALFTTVVTAPFRRKDTVEALVSNMEGQVDRLLTVAQRELRDAEAQRERANAAVTKAQAHEEEARRAERVASRITSLIR